MCTIPYRLRNNNIKSIKSPNRLFPFPIISCFFLKNIKIKNNLPDVFLILFVIFQWLHLYPYSISPTFIFRNQFINLMLSLLISLLLFVLDSFLNSRFHVLLSMFILLFFVECCLRMLIFYGVLEFRISIPPFLCRYVSLHCLFLFSFVISLKYIITLNFKHLSHVLLEFLLNSIHIKFFRLLQKYYFLGLNE